ncbi:hypothetical protein GCM10007874_00170 [Labrys miyagiensis]|uniref:Pentapeptide repeat-containing protein n=1 Tax=Labrys miyagiensis TaxID=346912 RepID=A0ABQ6CBH7_9HYPH|nr:pentapeptide repeat-containing protein [Labrys miyagiensis]GLS17002.1 hypothetical protein GCM10007874_00170 [Labrys miyagiensis]
MASAEHVALLKQGVPALNAWRHENPDIHLRLSGADLNGANLNGADLNGADLSAADLRKVALIGANLFKAMLSRADLSGADLNGVDLNGANLFKESLTRADLIRADLRGANLRVADLPGANLNAADLNGADLREANLKGADLRAADLRGADLREADLRETNLNGVDLTGADLTGANFFRAKLTRADLIRADLRGANLGEADLPWANLSGADLNGADLRGANLSAADLTAVTLVDADLTHADLSGCRVYGVAAWGLKLEGAKQQSLIVTRVGEPEITVDNIEVAQFIYLLLHNEKIRDVIDTIGKKAVLILGRFADKRKAILDALREELRSRDYLPILFDFDLPAARDITETVSLLARMSRFIIADLTDPSSIPKELEAIVPHLAVPVQPLLEGSCRPYAMFQDYWKYDWMLPVYRYEGLEPLLAMLGKKVIAPAERKVKALQERRRVVEAELARPR